MNNNQAWEKLFSNYDILSAGYYMISADQLREYREPRLMTKADTFERVVNLCKLLDDNLRTKPHLTEQYAFNEEAG